MTLTINSRRVAADPGETLEGLLDRLGLLPRYCLVERNGEPVERRSFGRVRVAEGDRLVVAKPTAGG